MDPSVRDERGAVTPEDIARLLDEAAARLSGRTETVVVAFPAPVAPPAFLPAAFPSEDAFIWEPTEGPRFAGIGAAFSIEAAGDSRFDDLRKGAEHFWKTLARLAPEPCAERLPSLFGGCSFHAHEDEAGAWRGFPACSFVLPRWCYGVHGNQAWLSLALRGPEERARIRGYRDDLERVLRAAASPRPTDSIPPVVVSTDQMEPAEWRVLVEKIRAGIREELFRKVVLARRAVIAFARPLDPVGVYERIERSSPDSHRFLFRRGPAAFVGASPELLVRKEGRAVETEALAGSIRASASDEENRLLAIRLLESEKDLGEHALVVDAIRRKLEAFSAELQVPARPRVRRLRSVLHLHTPMTGLLAHDTHILDLAAALHPTPSVGGVPTADAVRWIAENEPAPRGWYSGIVGRFDAEGAGIFVAAIRSALLCGARAHVYAGAGIVRDSDPDSEYEETSIKMRAMLSALGVLE